MSAEPMQQQRQQFVIPLRTWLANPSVPQLPQLIEDNQVIVGVVAVPAEAAQDVADELVRAGVRIVFNYSGALIDVPPHVTAHTTSPAVELLYALYFHLA